MTAPETRILIFGQSNSAGVQLLRSEETWPQIVAATLERESGRPVTVTLRPFYAHVPGADAYLERELARHEADMIVLMLTSFPFLAPVIGPGVRRRFGNRAGDAYQWLESRFDTATRHRGTVASGANRAARRILQVVLGAAPVASYETARDATIAAMRRLAREESAQVVALHGFVRLGRRAEKRAALLERFLTDISRAADDLRLVHINAQSRYDPRRDGLFYPDGVHVNAAGHRAIAAVVLEAFQDGRIASAHPLP